MEDQSEEIWSATWGCSIMRVREEQFSKIPGWDEKARNASDLGFLWSMNVNFVPMTCWYVIALLNKASIREKCVSEAKKALLPNAGDGTYPRFDSDVLLQQPYLRSVLNVVLRTQETSVIARSTVKDYQMGDQTIKKGSLSFVSVYLEHMDKARWETRPNAMGHPVDQFWHERFIEKSPDSGDVSMSTKGLEGTFIPFGFGKTECPGRNFSTRSILTIGATLLLSYEFEPVPGSDWPQPEFEYNQFSYAAFRPLSPLPFRIRKNVVSW